jgi:hypothetical protein
MDQRLQAGAAAPRPVVGARFADLLALPLTVSAEGRQAI